MKYENLIEKGFPGRDKLGLYASLVLSFIVLVALSIPAFAADSPVTNTDNPDSPPPVSVPVILDGKLYQPDEFNRINTESHAKGVYLDSVVDPENGTLMAFTSIDGMDKWLKGNNLPTT